MKFFFNLCCAALLILGCKSSNTKNMIQQELSGSYDVYWINNISKLPTVVSLSFDNSNKRLSGDAGCNSIFSSYNINDHQLLINGVGLTKKLCRDEAINRTEVEFVKALEAINTYKFVDNELILSQGKKALIKATPINTMAKQSVKTKHEGVQNNYNSVAIMYRKESRAGFEYLEIANNKELKWSTDSYLKTIDTQTISAADWKRIEALIDVVNLEQLNTLKAPTNKRLHDGAAHANVNIKIGDVLYMSPSFDHGYPPLEIEALIRQVLQIKQKYIKA